MTQLGLDLGLTLNLLQNELGLVDYNDMSPPKCVKLVSAGSIKTLSVTATSPTQRTSKIDAYFDAACKKPYVEATVQVTVSTSSELATFVETATYLQPNGMPLGTLDITDYLSVENKIETLRGLGTFGPTGGQPAANVGFTCSIPASGTAKTANCQGGVVQTFRSLNLSLASVLPFTLTASTNAAAPSVKLAGTASNLRTGPAGSLSLSEAVLGSIEITGGGTAYTTTLMSGGEGRFVLFPPEPTLWSFTDKRHNARFAYHVASNTTHAARASVDTISPAKALASITLDQSGTGKVTYSDGRSALVRGFLAAD